VGQSWTRNFEEKTTVSCHNQDSKPHRPAQVYLCWLSAHRKLPAINRTKLMECWESAASISTFSKHQRFWNLHKKESQNTISINGRPSSGDPGSLHGLRVTQKSHDAGGGNQTDCFLNQHQSTNENGSFRSHACFVRKHTNLTGGVMAINWCKQWYYVCVPLLSCQW
jgi:hypothetical protein